MGAIVHSKQKIRALIEAAPFERRREARRNFVASSSVPSLAPT